MVTEIQAKGPNIPINAQTLENASVMPVIATVSIELAQGLEGDSNLEKVAQITSASNNPNIPNPPVDSAGHVEWAAFYRSDPTSFAIYMESVAKQFFESNGELTGPSLSAIGETRFVLAARRYYEGGFFALKKKTSLAVLPEPAKNLPKPANYWTTTEGQDEVRQVVGALFIERGEVTLNMLKEIKRNDVYIAIVRRYPGGWTAVQNDLGIKITRRYPDSVTLDTVLEEITAFVDQNGDISSTLLSKVEGGVALKGRIDNHYPGGLIQVQKDFGLKYQEKKGSRHNPYWTQEQLEQEALTLCRANGNLSTAILLKQGRTDFLGGAKKYPGGIAALRAKTEAEVGVVVDERQTVYSLWAELHAMGVECTVGTVETRVERYRVDHPNWIEPYYAANGERRGEKLAEELSVLIKEELSKLQKAEPGWLTIFGIANKIHRGDGKMDKKSGKRKKIQRIAAELVRTNPELTRKYHGQGGMLDHYSPIIVREIERQIKGISEEMIPSEEADRIMAEEMGWK